VRQHVPDVVAVASGKGGVGKTTVAVNLSLALRDRGVRIGLVDADLHGPDVPRMLGLTRRRDTEGVMLWSNPKVSSGARPLPLEHDGIKLVSAQLLMGEAQPFAPDAGFARMLLRRFLDEVDWGDVQVLVVDLPPGTGDMIQHLASLRAVAGALVVVTPQDVAHLDARKLVALLRQRGVPILGGVENMAGMRCPHCDDTIELFPPTTPERTIWHDGVERLASIPFVPTLDASAFAGLAEIVAERVL
jgi:ATP-binding protein involved in chromosome partitioning